MQINPIERAATPRMPREEITDRMNEITFNAALLAELRAADFVARLIDQGALNDPAYRRELLHRIGGDGEAGDLRRRDQAGHVLDFPGDPARSRPRTRAKDWLGREFRRDRQRGTLDVSAALASKTYRAP